MAGDEFCAVGKPPSLGSQYTRPGGEPSLAARLCEVYGPRFQRELRPEEVVTTIGAQEPKVMP